MPCCFKAPVRKEGQRIVTRFQLQDDIEVRGNDIAPVAVTPDSASCGLLCGLHMCGLPINPLPLLLSARCGPLPQLHSMPLEGTRQSMGSGVYTRRSRSMVACSDWCMRGWNGFSVSRRRSAARTRGSSCTRSTSPTKMRYIGSKVASCNVSADAVGVAPSIAPWVKPKGVLEGKRLRARTVQCIHVLLMNFALHACVHA